MVVSTYSLVVKFLTLQAVGILRGGQAIARSCFVTSLCKNAVSETLSVEEMDPRGEKERMSLDEELTQLVLDFERLNRSISICSLLEPAPWA